MSAGPAAAGGLATMRRTSVREAARTRPFWLVMVAFFICGYGDVFFTTHLVPFAVEAGIPDMAAAGALGLMGGFSFLGVLVAGAASDRVGRKNPLAALYFFRALALAALALSSGELTVYLAAAVVGLTFISPGPLASALLADRYGALSVGALYGLAILSHQIGGALGAYLGGLIFDTTGSYYWSFVSAALLTLIAAGAAFSIRELRPRPGS